MLKEKDVFEDLPDTVNEPIEYDEDEGVYREYFVVKAYWDGRHKVIPDEIGDSKYLKLTEDKSKIGSPDVKYPREFKHCRTRMFTGYMDGRSVSIWKLFKIDVEEPTHLANEYKEVIDRFKKLPTLENEIENMESYEEMLDKVGMVRDYMKIYNNLKATWHKDRVIRKSWWKSGSRDFEMKLHRKSYRTPMLYHSRLNRILSDELDENGAYSVAWGGFLYEAENFHDVYETLKPFYDTPEDGGF